MPLSAKKQRFVTEYLVDLSKTAAAIRAGYSAKTANQIGYRLALEPAIATEIARQRAVLEKRTQLSVERTLRELGRLAHSDIADIARWTAAGGLAVLDLDAIPAEARAAIKKITETRSGREIKLTVELHDKLGALRLLAAHQGIGSAPPEGEDEDVEKHISDDPDPPREARGGA